MEDVRPVYIVLFLMAILPWSCGKNRDIARVSALEERMSAVEDPVRKSELANLLHREYAVYHLNNASDTLFLRRWARMAEEGREYEEAIEVYSMLVDRDPSLSEVYVSRARLYAGLGYYREASADYNKAVVLLSAKSTEKSREYKYWADYYHKADAVIRAEGEFIADGDNRSTHLLNRAAQYYECGYYSAAVADIRPVLEADSANARALYLLAMNFLASGEYDRSSQEFERYFSLADPADPYYMEAEKQQKRLVQLVQLQTLELALESEPYSYQHLVDASAAAFRLQKYNKAMIYATRLSEVFPDSIFGYLYRGQVHIQSGSPEQALGDMDRVLELDTSNISARNLRAYVFLLDKDYNALQQEINEIISRGGTLLEVLRPFSPEGEK